MLPLLISLITTPAAAGELPTLSGDVTAAITAEGYRPHLHRRGAGAPITVFACTRSRFCNPPALPECALPEPHYFDDRPEADRRWQAIDPTP